MSADRTDREYTTPEEPRQSGDTGQSPTGRERRENPRLPIVKAGFDIATAPDALVLDLSVSGIAFLSGYPLAPDERIEIELGDKVSATAEVVACELEAGELDDEFIGGQFRIECRFDEIEQGKRLLDIAKNLGMTTE